VLGLLVVVVVVVVVVPAIEILLGAPIAGLDFFSSPDVVNFVVSSTELTDARAL
jgi:hypothetical protein